MKFFNPPPPPSFTTDYSCPERWGVLLFVIVRLRETFFRQPPVDTAKVLHKRQHARLAGDERTLNAL